MLMREVHPLHVDVRPIHRTHADDHINPYPADLDYCRLIYYISRLGLHHCYWE